MSSVLYEIKDSVMKYAQVIKDVIGMDVDVADSGLMRIAGTGAFSKSVGKNITDEGHALQSAIRDKQFINIDNPGKSVVCLDCPTHSQCMEKYEICCPILLNGEAIGAMAIATFDEIRIEYIEKNLIPLKNFLENIAEMIAAKVAEYRDEQRIETSLELLRKLINFINEGVIIFNQDRSILFLNRKAELLLGYELRQLKYLKKIREFTFRRSTVNEKNGEVEYQFKFYGKVVKVIGHVYPIVVDERESARVFIFEDVAALHQNYFQTGHDTINFDFILGNDKMFCKVKQQAKEYACSGMNLLICGESGTGKEVFARAICNESPRKKKPYVSVSCNGTLDEISEKELFGNLENGTENKCISKFELASGGTLFIDGIEHLPLRLQSRLVKFMTESHYDVRILASTAVDLEEQKKNGAFASSLYYMLDVNAIHIPPLRKRKRDIRLLLDFFLEKYNGIDGKQVKLSDELYNILQHYSWPGNVRELDCMVSMIVNCTRQNEPVCLSDLPQTLCDKVALNKEDRTYNLKEIEKQTILHLLNSSDINSKGKKEIADALGISVASLYRKISEYGIDQTKKYYISK